MTYTVKSGDTLSKIASRHRVTLVDLLAANPRYKADPNSINVGDKVEIPERSSGSPKKAQKKAAKGKAGKKKAAKKKVAAGGAAAAAVGDPFTVPFGQLTFDAEGSERPGRFFSRRLHVPSGSSGATIGRGYDMREKSRDEIIADLVAAGVPKTTAGKLARAHGRKGKQAREFIADNGLGTIEITPEQQRTLFLRTYQELEGDVIRICNKADVIEKYGGLKWRALDPKIRDVLVDLRYRGDYTGATREKVQPPAVDNNLVSFGRVISNEDYWIGQRRVPKDRFKRRREYLQAA